MDVCMMWFDFIANTVFVYSIKAPVSLFHRKTPPPSATRARTHARTEPKRENPTRKCTQKDVYIIYSCVSLLNGSLLWIWQNKCNGSFRSAATVQSAIQFNERLATGHGRHEGILRTATINDCTMVISIERLNKEMFMHQSLMHEKPQKKNKIANDSNVSLWAQP